MPQHVVAAVPEQFLEWDAEGALRALAAPLLYVDASQMTDLERLAELVPTVAIARTVAVGHMQLIAHPRQAVAAIEDFQAAHGRPPVDNRAPVLALFDAVQSGELERIDDLVSADFVDHGAPPGMIPPGPEGYRTIFRLLKGALRIDYAVLDVVAEGESVMAWVRCTGRHVGGVPRHPADRPGVRVRGHAPLPGRGRRDPRAPRRARRSRALPAAGAHVVA